MTFIMIPLWAVCHHD